MRSYGLLTGKMLLRSCHPPERPGDGADFGSRIGGGASARPRTCFSARACSISKRLKQHGVRTAVATDIGGGSSYSMLRTLDEAYKIQQPAVATAYPRSRASGRPRAAMPRRSGWWNGSARWNRASDADIIVLDAGATPAMAIRMETSLDPGRGIVPDANAGRRPVSHPSVYRWPIGATVVPAAMAPLFPPVSYFRLNSSLMTLMQAVYQQRLFRGSL
jgi:hypothetical protein